MCVKSENFDALPMQHNEIVTQKKKHTEKKMAKVYVIETV